MKRVRTATRSWAIRLAAALIASLAIHIAPLAIVHWVIQPRPLELDFQVHPVEIGFDTARDGPRVNPAVAPPPAVPRALPTPPEPSTASTQPNQPSVSQRTLHAARDTRRGADDAMAEPSVAGHSRLRTHVAEPPSATGAIERHAAGDAGATRSTELLPTFSAAAGTAATMVPRGALITVTIHTDRVRSAPAAPIVRRLLRGIPDWQEMLGGSQLDPLNDLDLLVLAAANPVGAHGQPPDWFVIARGANGSDAALRSAVEAMARSDERGEDTGAPPPSRDNPPPLDGGTDDAMALSAASPREQALRASVASRHALDAGRTIWRDEAGGVQIATLERYRARRSFVMLGDGVAAIALPGQVAALLSAWSRRPADSTTDDDPRLAVLVTADGLRNLIEFNTWRGPFPIPRRATLGIFQMTGSDGNMTGEVELHSSWRYDSHDEADHAREMFEYSRGQWHALIEQRLGPRGGLGRLLSGAVASLVGVNLGELERALDALTFRADEDRLVIHAALTDAEVTAVLNGAALGLPP